MSAKLKIDTKTFSLNYNGDLNISCIYSITEIESGKIYIGKAKNLLKRYNDHKSALNNNRHYNIYLQRVFNKGKLFVMNVIEILYSYDNSSEREDYYINYYKSLDRNLGFNLAENVTNNSRTKKIDVYDREGRFIETLNSVNSGVGKYATNRVSISRILAKCKYYQFTKQGFTFCYHNDTLNILPYKYKYNNK